MLSWSSPLTSVLESHRATQGTFADRLPKQRFGYAVNPEAIT